MLADVLKHSRLRTAFEDAGFFETESHRKILAELEALIPSGRLITVTAIKGTGKTVGFRHIRNQLRAKRRMHVSTSLDVNKDKVKINTLMNALFADLAIDKDARLPSGGEMRARRLRDLVKERKKPVALFVDEAQDLNLHTIRSLKHLQEVVEEGGGKLSIVLIGLPKLAMNLKRAAMEEIGARSWALEWPGLKGRQREYFDWLIEQCGDGEVTTYDIFTPEAVELLIAKLSTPLQITHYGWRSLAEHHHADMALPVGPEVIESVLAPDFSSLDANLSRNGYDFKALAQTLDIAMKDARSFARGNMSSEQSQKLYAELLRLGLVA